MTPKTWIIAAAASAAAAITAPAAMADPLNVRIGWSTMPAHMVPAYFALPEILEHHGDSYTVNLVSFAGSTPQITAMAAREIDIAVFSGTALAFAVLNAGIDVMVVADNLQDGIEGSYSQSFFVKTDSGIDSIEDLAGRTIATNAVGSANDTMLRATLRAHDMDPTTDVNIIEVSFGNMRAMIEDDRVDAAPIPQPTAAAMVDSGAYKRLFSSVDTLGPTQFTFLAARADFLEENREALYDFFEDLVRAHQWYADPANAETAQPILAQLSQRPIEGVQHLFTEIDYYRDPFLIPNPAGIQTTIDISYELGILPATIQVEPDMVDLSFVEEAKRRIEGN